MMLDAFGTQISQMMLALLAWKILTLRTPEERQRSTELLLNICSETTKSNAMRFFSVTFKNL